MNPNLITGFHHVSINVDDIDAAVGFYVDLLGLPVVDRPDFPFDGRWLAVGDRQLHLVVSDVPTQEGQHLALEVTDLDAMRDTLRENGIDTFRTKDLGFVRQSFANDPAGNLVEFTQPK